VVTIVGSDAHVIAASQMAAMNDIDMPATQGHADEGSVSLLVAPERTEDALRFLHSRLFELESSQ
jgi:aspartokinase